MSTCSREGLCKKPQSFRHRSGGPQRSPHSAKSRRDPSGSFASLAVVNVCKVVPESGLSFGEIADPVVAEREGRHYRPVRHPDDR